MITTFSVSNFRSFSSEETFSLVASNRLVGSHDDHVVTIPDSNEKVLKIAVLYGANGAGKSNLFKALRYVKSIALDARDKKSGTGREPFRFGEGVDEPSSFDLQFIAGGNLYRFGFKVDVDRIIEEWLVRVVGKSERVLYQRVTTADGKVKVDSSGLKKLGDKLSALATVGGPPNQSFLATIHVTLDSSDYGEELNEILNWFAKGLSLVGPDEPIAPVGNLLAEDSNFSTFAGDFLRDSSTGVDHLDVQKIEITEDDLSRLLPKELVSHVLKSTSGGLKSIIQIGEGTEVLFEQTDRSHYYRITIHGAHHHAGGTVVPLEFSEESDGTQRLLNLLPALHCAKIPGTVYFIDEIDRSMHPMLAWKFLDFFLKSCSGDRRQIIVTTHEANLLDLDLLRRDEIWFAEKDHEESTRLYSMTDFKVRKDHEIRKHYLQGRYGAVPFLGNLDHLIAKESQAK
ncbi:MAG: AAA family ATPase [Terracidiphilus sp.]|nr:AAA family ATPase [Terracidiphilus sp.]